MRGTGKRKKSIVKNDKFFSKKKHFSIKRHVPTEERKHVYCWEISYAERCESVLRKRSRVTVKQFIVSLRGYHGGVVAAQ